MSTIRGDRDGRPWYTRIAIVLVGRHCLGIASGQALPPIIRNGAIDDRAAVDTFPGVENQEEVGEAFQHHETFALRTFHRILPGCEVYRCCGW
jgi:hypothetical protein